MGNETLYWDDLIWLSVDAKPIGRKSCVFKSILLSVDVALVAGLRAYSLHKYITMRILSPATLRCQALVTRFLRIYYSVP